jgi:hypothetical protein
MEAHPEPVEVYVGAVEPNPEVLEAHPGALKGLILKSWRLMLGPWMLIPGPMLNFHIETARNYTIVPPPPKKKYVAEFQIHMIGAVKQFRVSSLLVRRVQQLQ